MTDSFDKATEGGRRYWTLLKIAEGAIRSMRKESDLTSEEPSIYWKGLLMTVEEARAVIESWRDKKLGILNGIEIQKLAQKSQRLLLAELAKC